MARPARRSMSPLEDTVMRVIWCGALRADDVRRRSSKAAAEGFDRSHPLTTAGGEGISGSRGLRANRRLPRHVPAQQEAAQAVGRSWIASVRGRSNGCSGDGGRSDVDR